MGGSIQAIGSSLSELSDRYQTITHNLANASSSGYKRLVTSPSSSATSGSAAEDISKMQAQTSSDFRQGNLVRTGRPLDLALQGDKGFFVIERPQGPDAQGPLYTRNGVFQLNANRQLVDAANQLVRGQGGPITLPPSVGTAGFHVSQDGTIVADGQTIGKLDIVQFDDLTALKRAGQNCFQAPETLQPKAAEGVKVCQGFLESSNVSVVEELVSLITVSRMYEANLKSIHTQDDRMKHLLQVAMS